MPSFHKKLFLALALLLAFQSLVTLGKYIGEVHDGAAFGGDFQVFWRNAQALGAHDIAAIYDTNHLKAVIENPGEATDLGSIYVYPPHSLFMLWPLQFFSYNSAVLIWSLVPLPFYFFLAYRMLWQSPLRSDRLGMAAILLMLLPFLMANLFTGQTGALIGVLFLAVFYYWERSPVVSGVALGLLTIKPQLGNLLAVGLLAAGQWRLIGVAAATALLLMALATFWLGFAIWPQWLAIMGLYGEFLAHEFQRFNGLALGPLVSLMGAGVPMGVASVLQMVITLSLVALTYSVFRRMGVAGAPLLVVGVLLATPYSMAYDTPLLAVALLPFLASVWLGGWLSVREILAFAALLLMPYAQPMLMPYHVPFGMLAVMLFYVVIYRRQYFLRSF